MPLDLIQVRRLAVDVVRQESPALEVLAAISGEGGRSYAEIILRERNPGTPGRVVIGVDREASEAVVRRLLQQSLHKLRKVS